jgi:hypothetical protein
VRRHLGAHRRQDLLPAMLLGGQQANQLAEPLYPRGQGLRRGSGERMGRGLQGWAKGTSTSASAASVLARRPVAEAPSRTWRVGGE